MSLDPPPSVVELVKNFNADRIWKLWFKNLYDWLKENMAKDYFSEVSQGNVAGASIVHKFGKNKNVGANYEPLSIGGVYRTPQVAGETTIRVKAGGNANDTAGGSGAREISLECLDATGNVTTTTLVTAGASASAASAGSLIRVFRAWASESGTYASAIAGSHAADIVIENSAGTEDWLTIDSTGFPRGQSQIGVYTVPVGFTAYVYSYVLTTDSNKAVDFLFFKRGGILEAAAPYQAMRTVVEEVGIQGNFHGEFIGGQKFEELTDIGFMVKAAATAVATADFEILLIAN